MASLIAQLVKNPPAIQETLVRVLGREDPGRTQRLPTPVLLGFPCDLLVKESARNAGDMGSIPGLGRSPGKGKDYPLQYSGLENSMNSIGHRVAKSRIRLSHFHFSVRPHLPACNLPTTVLPCHRRVRRTEPEVRLRWAWLLATTSFPGGWPDTVPPPNGSVFGSGSGFAQSRSLCPCWGGTSCLVCHSTFKVRLDTEVLCVKRCVGEYGRSLTRDYCKDTLPFLLAVTLAHPPPHFREALAS